MLVKKIQSFLAVPLLKVALLGHNWDMPEENTNTIQVIDPRIIENLTTFNQHHLATAY